MKRLLLAAIVAMAARAPAWAQSSTTTGMGVGIASTTSSSQATSGQGGTGVGVGGNPSATITTNSTVPANQTIKSVPSVFAPGLAAAGLETCLGSVSGGGAFVGTGFSFGTTIPDPGCAARLDARTLWSFGLKKAAVARLCLNPDINRAMPEVCVEYMPPPARGYPAPPPVLTRYAQAEASEEPPYIGGDIWLVEGATGKKRLCNDYDVAQQSCRVWAHVVHHSAPKKKATASGERAGGFPKMERCTKTDDEPGLLQKTSMICGKFFPPVVPTEIWSDVRTALAAHHADEAVLKIGQLRFVEPLISVHHDPVAAFVVGAIAAHARGPHLSKCDLLRTGHACIPDSLTD